MDNLCFKLLLATCIVCFTSAKILRWSGSGSPFSFTVSETVPIGTYVAQLRAESDGHVIQYQLESSSRLFRVDEQGRIIVTSQLDYEQTNKIVLAVKATDDIGDKGVAIVNIQVENVNDNAPVFRDGFNVHVNVLPSTPIGADIFKVTALDPDGENVTYSIIGGSSSFSISSSTGYVKLVSSLSPDTNGPIKLLVAAVDDGEWIRFSSTATYVINVLHENPVSVG